MSTQDQTSGTRRRVRLATLPSHIRQLSRATRHSREDGIDDGIDDDRLNWTGESSPGQPGAMRRVASAYSVDVRTILRSRPVGKHGKNGSEAARRVYVNTPAPPGVIDQHGAVGNKVRTTKYTLWSFVPKNLFEQFRRAANVYFLFMAVIQIVPYFQVNNPGLTLFPICFVLVVTACKDGFEDWKRYQQDTTFNGTPTSTLQRWRNVNLDADDAEDTATGWHHRLARWLGLAWLRRTIGTYHSRNNGDMNSSSSRKDTAKDSTMTNPNTIDSAMPASVTDGGVIPEHPIRPTLTGNHSTASTRSGVALLAHGSSRDPSNAAFLPAVWQDVRIGDIVYIRGDDPIPADIVVLSTSEPDGECYVETKSLDGETNLKTRRCVPETIQLESAPECARIQLMVESEPPTSNLYVYRGTLHVAKPEACLTPELMELLARHANSNSDEDDENDYANSPDRAEEGENEEEDEGSRAKRLMQENFTSVQLDLNNTLLRGCVLRNTEWVIGVVVFAGAETKIMLNSGATPSKRSRIEKTMNYQVIINFVFLTLLSLGCAIGYSVYYQQWKTESAIGLFVPDDKSVFRAAVLNLLGALIVFQNIIPISLYISIEFVKTFHAFWIYSDITMYDEATDKPCTPKAWNLSDDLGQVEYVFSDKTGTLTRNIMEFRRCSIRGRVYGDGLPGEETDAAKGVRLRSQSSSLTNTNQDDADAAAARGREIRQQYLEEMQRVFRPRYATVDPQKLTFADPKLFIDLRLNETVGEGDLNDDDDASGYGQKCDSPRELSINSELSQPKDSRYIEENSTGHGEIDQIEGSTYIGDASSMDRQVLSPVYTPGPHRPSKVLHRISDSHSSRNSFGRAFTAGSGQQQSADPIQDSGFSTRGQGIREFFTLLSLCHTVIVERPDQGDNKSAAGSTSVASFPISPQPLEIIRYRAESPDEDALVSAARDIGFAFLGRRRQELLVDILGVRYTYEQLNLLPFDSTRKRMSVIVRRPAPWNDIVIYTKGADNVILERLASGQNGMIHRTKRDVDRYSQEGLRVLLLAYRRISTEEYEEWQRGYQKASTSLSGRDALMDACAEEIEQDLTLIGATAIEDKLQERVPETIASLRQAGMKVWVLTGDKLETAINIGYSCSLLTQNMRLWTVRGSSSPAEIVAEFIRISKRVIDIESERAQGTLTGSDAREHALVIDGKALKEVLNNIRSRRYLLRLATRCRSVICCRVSPLQKAQVVHLVRKGRHAITLAIGDGANDVSMIQAANLGIAIAGQEGLQASMASDYTIGQFRFLKPLLLVHGQWSYLRVAEMILNFFYKNILYALVVFFYQIYCGYSSNIFYDYIYVQLYNLLFTLLPVIVLGCCDQIVNAPRALHYPSLYKMGINQTRYNMRRFWIYTVESVAHAAAIFFIFYGVYKYDPPTNAGYSGGIFDFSSAIITAVIIVAALFVGLNTYSWNYFMHIAVWGSVLLPIGYLAVISAIEASPMYGVGWIVFPEANFWLPLILTIFVVMLPRFLFKYCKQIFFPEDVDIIREMQKHHLDSIKSQQRQHGHPNNSKTAAPRNQKSDSQQADNVEMREIGTGQHPSPKETPVIDISNAANHNPTDSAKEFDTVSDPSQPAFKLNVTEINGESGSGSNR